MLSERSSVWGARVGGPPTGSRGARVLMNIEHRAPEARQSTPGGSKRIANNDFLLFAMFFEAPGRPLAALGSFSGGSWRSWAALGRLLGSFEGALGREGAGNSRNHSYWNAYKSVAKQIEQKTKDVKI